MGVPVRFYSEPQGQKYADGLERVELYLLRKYEGLVVKPLTGQRTAVEFVTKTGTYRGGLRTNPPSGSVYLCPDLSDQSGEKISLARVLKDNCVENHKEVEVVIDGDVLRLA